MTYRPPARIVLLACLLLSPCATRLDAAVWFVATNGSDAADGTNWLTAKQTIQAAIDAAAASDTILVSNGIYQTGGAVVPGSQLTNRVVIDKAVDVASLNGPDVTVIRGAWQPGGTNGDAAVRCTWIGSGATLTGFTLTNGATRTTGSTETERSGGGLWCGSAAAVVSNCVLTGNAARNDGGGAYGGVFYNCTFAGNQAFFGGAASFYIATGMMVSCVVTGNYARSDGGGTYEGTLDQCMLADNFADSEGGGSAFGTLTDCSVVGNATPYCGGGSYGSTLVRCLLSSNSGDFGGGADNSILRNCILSGNTASSGGGSAQGTLENCTVFGNAASGQGGGTYQATVRNCIVYSNTAPTDENDFNSTFLHSCTTPHPGGTANFTNDPQFVDAVNGDFQLLDTSPCRDTGDNSFTPPGTDFDGNPRIVNIVVDMGAFENQSTPPPDYDSDLMPNWWESLNGLNPVESNAASADADTDLYTDIDEYIADTSPTNAASFFRVTLFTNDPPCILHIVMDPASSGRVYSVTAVDDLLTEPQVWTAAAPDQTNTAGSITITVTGDVPWRAYRTRVRLP